MKKSLVALAVLAASGAAMAQSTVTLYGRIDAGVANVKTETTGANPVASITNNVINSGILNTSYWGLKGSEDLGGGLKANFKLESKFYTDTGAMDPAGYFNRQAVVGFSGNFGTVNLGVQDTPYDSLYGATDHVGHTNVNRTGTVWATGIAGYSDPISNSIRYDSPVMNGFSASAMYGLGEDKSATVTGASSTAALNVQYASGPVLVGYAHQEQASTETAAVARVTTKYDLIAGSYDFGVVKLTGGYNKAKNGTLNDTEYQLGLNVPVNAQVAVMVGYAKAKSEGAAVGDLNGKGYVVAGTYSLSARTTLYAAYMNSEVEIARAAAASVNAGIDTSKNTTFGAGVRHLF